MVGVTDTKTTTDALAAFGLQLDAPPEELHQDIWPENVAAFDVFYRLRTQWAVGFNGAIGLRYECLALAMELECVPKEDWAEVTNGVQIMEQETLRIWRSQK